MLFRSKKLSAFMTGCLATTVIFGYPSQLLAQTNTLTDPIQGVTSTTQSPPANEAEIADAITGINAGLNPIDVGGFSPDPIREHTAFLTDMWSALLDSEYIADDSYLTTDEWVTGPTGLVNAVNENGNSVSIDIALSLELLPEEFGYDQETLGAISDISGRFGVAWTTMSNNQEASNILIWWVQWDGPNGISTEIGPLTTIDQENIDLLNDIVPLMNGFFDNPLNYNTLETLVGPLGIWSTFRTAIAIAVIVVAVTIIAVTVVGMISVAGVGAAALAGNATVAALGITVIKAGAAIVGAMITTSGGMMIADALAYNKLVTDLQLAGENLTGMTRDQILDLAEQKYF